MCCSALAARNIESYSTQFQSDDLPIGDWDWEPQPLARQKLHVRPKIVSLTLAAQEIPSLLANTNNMTKASARHELRLLSTLLKAGGADMIDTRLSNTVIPNYLFQAQVLTNGSSFFLMLITTNNN